MKRYLIPSCSLPNFLVSHFAIGDHWKNIYEPITVRHRPAVHRVGSLLNKWKMVCRLRANKIKPLNQLTFITWQVVRQFVRVRCVRGVSMWGGTCGYCALISVCSYMWPIWPSVQNACWYAVTSGYTSAFSSSGFRPVFYPGPPLLSVQSTSVCCFRLCPVTRVHGTLSGSLLVHQRQAVIMFLPTLLLLYHPHEIHVI